MTTFDREISMPMPTRKWLDPDESAAYLGSSRSQFNAKVAEYGLRPSYRMGAQRPRYHVNDLDNMMEAERHGINRYEDWQARQAERDPVHP